MSEKALASAKENPVEKNINETIKIYLEILKEKGIS